MQDNHAGTRILSPSWRGRPACQGCTQGTKCVYSGSKCIVSRYTSLWLTICILALYAAHNARGSLHVVASAKKKELFMWEGLREAIDEEMERDPTVCVMGKCIGLAWASVRWML